MGNKFKEEDLQNLINYLNFVAKKAKFNDISVEDNIKFFKMLNSIQVDLLPKIKDHIMELNRIIEPKKESKDDI